MLSANREDSNWCINLLQLLNCLDIRLEHILPSLVRPNRDEWDGRLAFDIGQVLKGVLLVNLLLNILALAPLRLGQQVLVLLLWLILLCHTVLITAANAFHCFIWVGDRLGTLTRLLRSGSFAGRSSWCFIEHFLGAHNLSRALSLSLNLSLKLLWLDRLRRRIPNLAHELLRQRHTLTHHTIHRSRDLS